MFQDPSKLAMNSHTAGSVEEAVGRHPSVLEPKYDGIRLLIHVAESGVYAYARSGKSKTGKLPAVEAELAEILPPGSWVDGEAVAFNPDGTQDWGGAQSVLGSNADRVMDRSKVRFVIFDILSHGGIDARALPLAKRRELLELIFEGDHSHVTLSVQMEATDDAHEANLIAGFEGSMVKHLDAPYQSGRRSRNSLKLKAVDTVDAVVTGFKPAQPGSWIDRAGLIGAIEFVHYVDGVAVEGRCSGMTVPERQAITEAGDDMIDAVIEVSYMTRMPSGSLRHPQFKRVRTDKTKEECRA